MFEWDPAKREANLDKHGVDFELAKLIFDGRVFEREDVRHDYGEVRIGALGQVAGEVLLVIYTWRGNRRRLISARKTGTHEQAAYIAGIARQD